MITIIVLTAVCRQVERFRRTLAVLATLSVAFMAYVIGAYMESPGTRAVWVVAALILWWERSKKQNVA